MASTSLFKDHIFSGSEHSADSFFLPHATLEALNLVTKCQSFFNVWNTFTKDAKVL
jgi:hypothetical protein